MLSLNWHQREFRARSSLEGVLVQVVVVVVAYQLLEYQTDMRRCRFDTLGKQTSAHLAGGPTPYKGWVPPARWVSAGAASPGPPTARVGLQPSRTVGGVHPPCGRDISPPAVGGPLSSSQLSRSPSNRI